MQTLDIISVNLWQILISLANLFLIFLIVKKFLFGPVKKVLNQRQAALDEKYSAAEKAQNMADANRKAWEEKMESAEEKANSILETASQGAKLRGEKIVAEAEEKAKGIIRQAEQDAALEMKKAEEGIRREIVSVSGALTEKMLEREITSEDHRSLIDSFLDKIGGEND